MHKVRFQILHKAFPQWEPVFLLEFQLDAIGSQGCMSNSQDQT